MCNLAILQQKKLEDLASEECELKRWKLWHDGQLYNRQEIHWQNGEGVGPAESVKINRNVLLSLGYRGRLAGVLHNLPTSATGSRT